jgi:hypothetical protein
VENIKEHHRVLLHVEDHGQIRPTEKSQGRRSRVQTEASVHSKLQQAKSSRDQQQQRHCQRQQQWRDQYRGQGVRVMQRLVLHW